MVPQHGNANNIKQQVFIGETFPNYINLLYGPIVYGHQEVLDPRYMGEGSETGAFKEGNNGYYIDDLDAIPYLYHLSRHHWAYQKGS